MLAPSLPRRLSRVAAGTVVAGMLLATVGFGVPAADAQDSALRWRSCGGGFECASLPVPLDASEPTGSTTTLALIRARAQDASERIGSLVVNPGGPGGSAVDFVRQFARTLPSTLRDRFDIVGFDPRGSGHSDAVECDYDMAAYYALDFTPDDAAERRALVEGVRRFVDACVAAEGDRLRHVTTEDTVDDLERVRVALGDEQLTFLGFSYGTYIGAKYAAEHPDRVRALVLDGAVDPSIDAEQLQLDQAAGFEGVLDGFLGWCRTTPDCAFHRDGKTIDAFDTLRARVDRAGLAVPDTRPARMLSQTEFDLGLAAILYEGRSGYEHLGEALDAADRGDGRDMADLSDSYTQRAGDGTYSGIEQAFLAISCADGPPVGEVADVERIERAAARVAPRTGPGIVNNSLACALWPFAGPEAAPVRAPDAAPIVVIGTRHDPATPFAWARALTRQLGSGVLVSAPGAQHTAFGLGNDCVDGAVERYLVDLEAPDRTLVCPRR